jgi:hypothetical protein
VLEKSTKLPNRGGKKAHSVSAEENQGTVARLAL